MRPLGKLGLLVALPACLISLVAKSDLLLNNAPKIFQHEIFGLLTSGRTVWVESAALEKVTQKNEPLVFSRISKPLEKISQPRLHGCIVRIVHRDDSRLVCKRSAEH